MLTSLTVRNLALVEEATIPFARGLNVITGETGAGKSVLMGALNLLLGVRADKRIVRTGEEFCSVVGHFLLADSLLVDAVLEQSGLDPCEDGLLIIRRVVKVEGAGQNLVNDTPVTLQLLKRLGDLLVDMHGPYDHQSLLDPDTQRGIVDAAGDTGKALAAYDIPWQALKATRRKRRDLEGDAGVMEQQLDLLRYRVNELEEADLSLDEEDALREEHTLVGNAQNIVEGLSGVLLALEDAEGNAFDALAAGRRMLDGIRTMHPDAATWLSEVDSLQTQLRELVASMRQVSDRVESDPERLQWLDDRLSVIAKMKKKYGPSIEDALQTLEESKERLQELENREQTLAELDREETKILHDLEQAGAVLRTARETSAKQLRQRILDQLLDLGFPQARFDIRMTPCDPQSSGMDEVDYQFAPNPGESMRSLKDIASSGEISRVMLAIKTLLAEHDRIPVMVFDEIDANVGGEMGHAIGRKMAEAGQTRQVLAITHLPQVAVHGHHHLAVHKEVVNGRTFTRVSPLVDDQRVDEIARMLGGKTAASVTAEHARELLVNAGRSSGGKR